MHIYTGPAVWQAQSVHIYALGTICAYLHSPGRLASTILYLRSSACLAGTIYQYLRSSRCLAGTIYAYLSSFGRLAGTVYAY